MSYKYNFDTQSANVSDLIGKTLTSVEVNEDKDEITFVTTEGEKYLMYHSQDCCESVTVEDICGDLKDLVGTPIVKAEESSSDIWPEGVKDNRDKYDDESFTWTFYNFATIKGYVTIRWYGSSNGYYSESVDFVKYPKGEK